MGKENTFQLRTSLERRKHKAYLESDEWLGVQNSVGGQESMSQMKLSEVSDWIWCCSPLCPQGATSTWHRVDLMNIC